MSQIDVRPPNLRSPSCKRGEVGAAHRAETDRRVLTHCQPPTVYSYIDCIVEYYIVFVGGWTPSAALFSNNFPL